MIMILQKTYLFKKYTSGVGYLYPDEYVAFSLELALKKTWTSKKFFYFLF